MRSVSGKSRPLSAASDFDQQVRRMKLRVTAKEREAAHKLEAQGKRFLVDFGLQHCGRLPKQKKPKAVPLSAAEKWRRLKAIARQQRKVADSERSMCGSRSLKREYWTGEWMAMDFIDAEMTALSRVRVRIRG